MSAFAGFSILLRKELAEAWRTRRLPLVLLLFVVIGIISPLTGRYLKEILDAALGDQLPIPLPEPNAAAGIAQLVKNMGQLGAMAGIALAMGAVASEIDRGTAALVLAQPVGRGAFLAAKAAAVGLSLALAVGVTTAIAAVYTAILFAPLEVLDWVAFGLLQWLALAAWAALALLASSAVSSVTAAAGASFAAWIGVSLLAVVPTLDRVLPTSLAGISMAVAEGIRTGDGVMYLGSAVAGSLALIAASLVGAWLILRRRAL